MVINKLETDHQRVSSAKYFAALRKISRSSRNLAFSFSNARMRSESDTAAAWALASIVRVFLPVPNSFFHCCNEARLNTSSAAAAARDKSSLFSYRATASLLNCSEWSLSIVGRTPFLPARMAENLDVYQTGVRS